MSKEEFPAGRAAPSIRGNTQEELPKQDTPDRSVYFPDERAEHPAGAAFNPKRKKVEGHSPESGESKER